MKDVFERYFRSFWEVFLKGLLERYFLKVFFERSFWKVFINVFSRGIFERSLISFTCDFVIFEWAFLIEFIVHYSTLKKKGWSREKVTKYRSYALLMRDGQWGWSIICWRTPRHLPPPCCNTHCTDESLTQWVSKSFWTNFVRYRGCFPKFANDKWPFYDHFWSFFRQLQKYLSKNWSSNGHFEVLSRSEP